MQGVVVVMATRNSSAFIRRTLASIDRALAGRPYALVVADDASTDRTVRMIREAPTTACDRIVVTLPKALCVAEAKNRAMRLAMPLLPRFPWVAFMDDDDEMMPGRFQTVLAEAELEGQQWAAGDLLCSENGGPISLFRQDEGLFVGGCSPCSTVVHRDLIPKDGRYFPEVQPGLHEDMVAHHLLQERGVPLCYHGGAPTHMYHQRTGGVSGGRVRSSQMTVETRKYLEATCPKSSTSVRSFCTVGVGDALEQTELLVRSIRLTGNQQPVVVLTDAEGQRVIQSWGLEDVEAFVVDWGLFEKAFIPLPPQYSAHPTGVLPACLAKMSVLREAIQRHGSSLYLDSDMLVLRRVTDVIDAPVGLTPELPRSVSGSHSSWYGAEKFGYFNGGQVYASAEGLSIVDWWRKDYLDTYARWGSLDATHGCFVDQSSLDLIPLFGPTHTFHPGHDVMFSRVPRWVSPDLATPEEVKAAMKIQVGRGLYFRGWPVVTMHVKLRSPGWATLASRVYRQILLMSTDPAHVEIMRYVDQKKFVPS